MIDSCASCSVNESTLRLSGFGRLFVEVRFQVNLDNVEKSPKRQGKGSVSGANSGGYLDGNA